MATQTEQQIALFEPISAANIASHHISSEDVQLQSLSLQLGNELIIPIVLAAGEPNGSDTNHDNDYEATRRTYTHLQKFTATTSLSLINFTNSSANGMIIVTLPALTTSLSIPPFLAFWPESASILATASTLLLSGSLADVVGALPVDLLGSLLTGVLMLGCGGAKDGSAMVAMRAVQGVGYAMHLASSVSLISQIFARGRGRNLAFSCLGLSQPLGFSFGLVIGGAFVDSVGWRMGWYILGACTLVATALGLWVLPRPRTERSWRTVMRDLEVKVDWVGALVGSAFMALLSYLLAVLSTDISRIKEPGSIVMLCISAIALPVFIYWVDRQVRLGRPALIPNSLWQNSAFSSICGTVVLSFAVVSSLELVSSLYFQEVQHLSALQASIRMLPSFIVGAALNFIMGFFVDRIPAIWIVVTTSLLCAVSPLLMAVIQPEWTYWANAFVAQLLMPVSVDALFTVGLIVVTEVFPDDTQALAGAVFNTAAQFGGALGLAIMQIISTLVTEQKERGESMDRIGSILEGYKACSWTMFAFMITCGFIGWAGLRKTGPVSIKRE